MQSNQECYLQKAVFSQPWVHLHARVAIEYSYTTQFRIQLLTVAQKKVEHEVRYYRTLVQKELMSERPGGIVLNVSTPNLVHECQQAQFTIIPNFIKIRQTVAEKLQNVMFGQFWLPAHEITHLLTGKNKHDQKNNSCFFIRPECPHSPKISLAVFTCFLW